MKLLDLLVKELPSRGGWPDARLVCCCQSVIDSEIYFYDEMFENSPAAMGLSSYSFYPSNKERVQTGRHQYVSREQYEEALEVSRETEWNGAGPPPVGIKCEYLDNGSSWGTVKVIGYDKDEVVFKPSNELYYAAPVDGKSVFRPLKSESHIARQLTITSLQRSLLGSGYRLPEGAASIVLDAIAQGKVSGVKLID